MLPVIASSISRSLGLGVVASNPAACMIWPLWQYPHWGTARLRHAATTRRPIVVAPMPSMVVIF